MVLVGGEDHFWCSLTLLALCGDIEATCISLVCISTLTNQCGQLLSKQEMADDGSGTDIGIPSFLLFKEDADEIKQVLNQNQVVRVEMSFSVPNPDDRVEYDFWSRPGDINSNQFFSNFKFIANALGKRAFFTPHYSIYDGQTAGCHAVDGTNQCLTLCTNHGRYCANDPDDDLYGGVSGSDVVTESLRRLCIWTHYGSVDGIGLNWWSYMEEFMVRCNLPDYFADPDCINDVYQHAGIDASKIDQCMRDSGGLDADQNNNKLDNEIKMQREKGVVLIPTSFVNDAKVKGAVSASNIFEAICSGFSEGTKPDICYLCGSCAHAKDCITSNGICSAKAVPAAMSAPGRVSTRTFASSMFLLICLFGGAGYWYYNRTREEMREQVRGILAEYMPLEDSEDGSPSRGNFVMTRSAPATVSSHDQDAAFMMQHKQQQHHQDMSFAGSDRGGYTAPHGGDPMRSSLMSS